MTEWQDSIFGHLQQENVAQKHNNFFKESSKFCQTLNKPSTIWQRFKTFCQSGKISPNLVTLSIMLTLARARGNFRINSFENPMLTMPKPVNPSSRNHSEDGRWFLYSYYSQTIVQANQKVWRGSELGSLWWTLCNKLLRLRPSKNTLCLIHRASFTGIATIQMQGELGKMAISWAEHT